MKSLIILRHARSQFNVGLTENMDSPITDHGVEQSNVLGRYFKGGGCGRDLAEYKWYVSPYLRCLMTLDNILKSSGIEPRLAPVVEPLLAEYLFHDAPSVPVPYRESEFPQFNWAWYTEQTFDPESNEKYLGRIQKFYDQLDEYSVIVTHGLTVMALAYEAQGIHQIPMWDYSINNCSITWIKRGRKRWWGRNLQHETEREPNHEPKDVQSCGV